MLHPCGAGQIFPVAIGFKFHNICCCLGTDYYFIRSIHLASLAHQENVWMITIALKRLSVIPV